MQAVVWGWGSLKLRAPSFNPEMAFSDLLTPKAVTGGWLSMKLRALSHNLGMAVFEASCLKPFSRDGGL
jgi:hypothetical protein